MGLCCICGSEGSFLAVGMWWCEKHYEMKGKDSEKSSKSDLEPRSDSQNNVDLGLKQV